MSQPRTAMLRLQSWGGGLNDTDPPHRIGDDQLSVATDVSLSNAGGIDRRDGVARASAQPATLDFRMAHRHTPSQLLSATELWAFPINASNFYRSTTGTTWTTVSVSDTGSSSEFTVTDAASFNGKLFVAYKKSAGTDRLSVWDGTSVRRAGISTPAAPTATNTGVGSYAATVRYYKVQFYYQDANSRLTYSDLSAALTFTPSGTGTGVVITKPTTLDSASGWRVWASSDNVSYYLIQAGAAVATTTYTDSANPSTYSSASTVIAPDADAYTPPWSAKYLLVDENRLLIAGSFETTRYASRIGWSSIGGTAAAAYAESGVINDDERFPSDNYLDLDSDEGGELTGMETLNGSVYVFKRYATYKLVRTGNVGVPYKPVTISKVVGAISRKSIVPGEDEAGNPCLYFLSERGPYRLVPGGLQYLGQDIETTWALVNVRPSTAAAHGVYYATSGRVIWWVPRSETYPNCRLTFHVDQGRANGNGRVVGGWTSSASTSKANYSVCSVLWPLSLTDRDSTLVPYTIHLNGAWGYPPVVWRVFGGQVSDDVVHATTGAITGTEAFTPVATTKMFELGLGQNNGVRDVYVACTPAAGGVAISATLSRDFGAETRTAARTFTGTTTRMPLQISDLTMAGAQFVGLSLTSPTQAAFTIDEVALRVAREEPV